MYAISFELLISVLKSVYGEPHNNAYFEIKKVLLNDGFHLTQGSVHISKNNDLTSVCKAINALSKIVWFKNSVRDIRTFKVEDWSDFTDIIKNKTL